MSELRKVARGWRWGRPPPLPRSAPTPPLRTEAAFETDWARRPWANTVRDVLQELIVLPAVRYVTSPRVSGRERLLRLTPPVVLASNHASHLDTAVVAEALPLEWRHHLAVGGAADYFFKGKIRGTLAALLVGAFPVERKRASAVSARLAVRLVQEGWNLILFPEGGRSPDGWMQELKPGAAFVAARTKRPLVPMWIKGTEHLLPKGAKRLRRGRVDILIGDPLFPRDGEDARELNSRLDESLRRLSTEADSDWWTAMRTPGGDPYGPDAARWRRVWARGDAPEKSRSSWT
ncbi:MAG TPA: lysophospholipid acyltransferase family protein [Actinomycetota bacterium]|nr:lysophospholipid acyltransferase family protein [Actinomycetota bacterium]